MSHARSSNYIQRRVLQPLLAILKAGATADRLAHAIALGAIMGIFPILGVTTLTCILLASIFRLNHAAVQLVNYAMYPIQLLLIIPLIKSGLWITHQEIAMGKIEELITMLQTDPGTVITEAWHILLAGVTAWIILAIPVYLIVYLAGLKFLRRAMKQDANRLDNHQSTNTPIPQ